MRKYIIRFITFSLLMFRLYSVSCQSLVVSDTDRVIISTMKYSLPLYIDFEKNRSIDVIISNYTSTCNNCVSDWIIAESKNNFQILENYPISPYEEGDTIKTDKSWNINSNLMLTGVMCAYDKHGCGHMQIGVGYWYNRSTPGYFGIMRADENDTLLGWVKIGFNKSDTIVEYAIEKEHFSSLNNYGINPIKIYPTVTSDYLNIECDQNVSNKITLINISGQVVLNQDLNSLKNKICISNLNAGLYIVRIYNNKYQSIFKIIKN